MIIFACGWKMSAYYSGKPRLPRGLRFQGDEIFMGQIFFFSGDNILGDSTTVIDNYNAYMKSLQKMKRFGKCQIFPGHGDEIENGLERVEFYIKHRRMRESQIVEQLETGQKSISDIVKVLYADVPEVLHPAASINVAMTLDLLVENKSVFIVDADDEIYCKN